MYKEERRSSAELTDEERRGVRRGVDPKEKRENREYVHACSKEKKKKKKEARIYRLGNTREGGRMEEIV